MRYTTTSHLQYVAPMGKKIELSEEVIGYYRDLSHSLDQSSYRGMDWDVVPSETRDDVLINTELLPVYLS